MLQTNQFSAHVNSRMFLNSNRHSNRINNNFKARFLVFILLLLSIATFSQSSIAVVNLINFNFINHHHVGSTIFDSHDNEYLVDAKMEDLIRASIDSLSSSFAGKYIFNYVDVDRQTKSKLSNVKKKKKIPFLDQSIRQNQFVLFLSIGTSQGPTHNNSMFKDFGFYTTTGRNINIYATVNFYLYGFDSEKGTKILSPTTNHRTKWKKSIEKEHKIKSGTVPDDKIDLIENEIFNLIEDQLVNFDKDGYLSRGILRVD